MPSLPINSILKGKKYNYRLEKVLGQGSFGITYKAKVMLSGDLGNLGTEITVAVKEFFMNDFNDRYGDNVITGANNSLFYQYRQKFIREAENLSRLHHPNIIKVLEFFEANNTAYYSMEFIEGGNLEQYIDGKGALSEKESLEMMLKIMDATQCMHRDFMLHLDIKPLNIMMRNGNEPVLIDFGLSKQFNFDGTPEGHTTISAGSPGYAPLEQWSYKKEDGFSPTLDIYALGATLYKMLTGMTPPDAMSILNEGFPEQFLIDRGINSNIIFVVKAAMDPLKNNRYQSIEKFIIAIRFLLDEASEENNSDDTNISSKSYKNFNLKATPTLPFLEIINGINIHWNPSISEEQKNALRDQFKYIHIVSDKFRLSFTSYDGEILQIGDSPRSFFDNSQFVFGIINNETPNIPITINSILSDILKLSELTGIPFRPAYKDEIRFMITLSPFLNNDESKTLCLDHDNDLVYFNGRDSQKTQALKTLDFIRAQDWSAQIVTDFSGPVVVEQKMGNASFSKFDVPFTQEMCDEIKYIGFNLFKTRNGNRWNIKSPLHPMSNLLPEDYDSITTINIWTIPGGGPYGGSTFFGICAEIGDFTYFYRLDRNVFTLIQKLSKSEIESRRMFT